MSTSVKAANEWLLSLHKLGIKFGLNNMRALAKASGHPERAFPAVHIAGTNGKGSCAAFLAAIAQAAGLKVGLTTSPHLARLNERIAINGAPISDRDLAFEVERIRESLAQLNAARPADPIRPTFFEATILLAFRYFAREKVDLAIVETGLGGRLDATNVLMPKLCVITNIALEHTELLGATLPAIAREKGGIIKRGVPLITGVREPAALAVLEGLAAKRQAPCLRLGREFDVRATNAKHETLSFRAADTTLAKLRLSLAGEHQRDNAALAFAAACELARLGFPIDRTAIRHGLENARWPGRLEWRAGNPPWLIDCAHNPAGIETLARHLETTLKGRRLLFVFAVMKDKDYTPMLARLAPLSGDWIFTAPPIPRAEEPKRLAALLPKGDGRVLAIADYRRALARAKALEGEYDCVVLAGSIYWVGAAQGFLNRHRPLAPSK